MVEKNSTSASKPSRRRRLPAAERRAQILAIARDLFVTEGFERASMRRIADAAGISPTAIYDHFADKEALLTAIAEEFFQGLTVALNDAREGGDPLLALRRLMENYVRYGLDHPNEYRLVFMNRLSRFVPTLSHRGHPCEPDQEAPSPLTVEADKAVASFGLLQSGIDRLVAAGLLRGDDPEGFADSVWAMGHGIVSLIITKGDGNFTPVDRWIDTAIGILMDGMRPRQPTPPPTSSR